MSVVEDMDQMGGAMTPNGRKDGVEMWRGMMIDDGVMTERESALTTAETVQR